MDNHTVEQMTDVERADFYQQKCQMLEQELTHTKHDVKKIESDFQVLQDELKKTRIESEKTSHVHFTSVLLGGTALSYLLWFQVVSVPQRSIFFQDIFLMIAAAVVVVLASFIVSSPFIMLLSTPTEFYRGKHPVLFSFATACLFSALLIFILMFRRA